MRAAVEATEKEVGGIREGFGFSGSTAQMAMMSTFSDIDMMNFVVVEKAATAREAASTIARYIVELNAKLSRIEGTSPGEFKLSGEGGMKSLNLNKLSEAEIEAALLSGCDDFIKMDYIVDIPGTGPTEQTIVLKVGYIDAKGKIRTISGEPGKLRTSANTYQAIMSQGARYRLYDRMVRDLEGFEPFSEENLDAMAGGILVGDIKKYSMPDHYNPVKVIKRALTLSLAEGNRKAVDLAAEILDGDVNTAYALSGRLEAVTWLTDPNGKYAENAVKALAGAGDLVDGTRNLIDRAGPNPDFKAPELLDKARDALDSGDFGAAGKSLREWVDRNSEETMRAILEDLESSSKAYKAFKK